MKTICTSCKWKDFLCSDSELSCKEWQPIISLSDLMEKKEMDKIQMTKKQAIDFYNVGAKSEYNEKDLSEHIKRWNEKGYIKKSAVEEAEELWEDILRDCFMKDNIESLQRYIDKLIKLSDKQHGAIQELKKELQGERL